MLDSFVLVLTLCGTLNSDNSHNGNSCEQFVIDSEQTEISCLQGVQAVHNGQSIRLQGLIDDASNDWFKTVESNSLECIIEDKE